ncbi:class I SAM-dependent methyltransferase [Jiella avicenniae]|uniref:Class I SAM-dependent methyltransferase n=1 Tax=Jiella avicenniae TaxID=2907202 RepID=A0A9X1P4Y7_9HYPH|nr:class I SAM-dependent methyltransferase [Jiella avicenniae]MCE7029346.1 class I SAM-dependent methyltransferase [Jiella avicenniae]
MLAPINARQLVMSHLKRFGIGIEVGVHKGDYSALLLNALRPQKLYLVDPWEHFDGPEYRAAVYGGAVSSPEIMQERYEGVRDRFASEIKAGTVEIVRQRSGKAAERFEDESVDFVYVDGDHTKEGVTIDVEAYWPKLKEGGVMAFDDYSLGGWWKDGVVTAVHAMLASRPCIIILAMDGQVVVRKIAKAN